MSWPIEILLNDFAIRCFRDTADRDYLTARLAYRARLTQPFLWCSLHCLEKYVKGILMLNRIDSKGLGHTVLEGLDRLKQNGKFEIKLPPETLKFVERLEDGAADRYYLTSFNDLPHDIIRLDQVVWLIRRYCQPLDYEEEIGKKKVNHMNHMLKFIERKADEGSKQTCIQNGWIEGVLKKPAKDETRKALIWKNLFFGPSTRRGAKYWPHWEAGNAPLYLHPEIVDEVAKYCFIPNGLKEGCRELVAERKVEARKAAKAAKAQR